MLVNNENTTANNIIIIVIENIVLSFPIPNGIVFPFLNNIDGLVINRIMVEIINIMIDIMIGFFNKNIYI